MANESPITGVRVDAPSFRTFDLVEMDNLSADLDVLESIIEIALVAVDDCPRHVPNALYAALNQIKRAYERHSATHDALIALKRGGA